MMNAFFQKLGAVCWDCVLKLPVEFLLQGETSDSVVNRASICDTFPIR